MMDFESKRTRPRKVVASVEGLAWAVAHLLGMCAIFDTLVVITGEEGNKMSANDKLRWPPAHESFLRGKANQIRALRVDRRCWNVTNDFRLCQANRHRNFAPGRIILWHTDTGSRRGYGCCIIRNRQRRALVTSVNITRKRFSGTARF